MNNPFKNFLTQGRRFRTWWHRSWNGYIAPRSIDMCSYMLIHQYDYPRTESHPPKKWARKAKVRIAQIKHALLWLMELRQYIDVVLWLLRVAVAVVLFMMLEQPFALR